MVVGVANVKPNRTVPIHNLRPNETTWTPAAVAFFDTETISEDNGSTETHQLRCWAAQLTVRRDKRKTVTRDDRDTGIYGADLATLLGEWSHTHPTLWVYAHNLSFDLTTSMITTHLAADGYTVTEFAVDSPSPFVKMKRGRSVITFADSFSWLPVKLSDVAATMGTLKPPLPANDGELSDWLYRCEQDVTILNLAMCAIMQWWDTRELGRWSITGSSSGWNVMRHKIDARRFTINPDPAGLASDRSAIYGGRRGIARTGPLKAGSYAELDFTSAYPVIAASLPLPLERMAHFESLPVDHRWVTSDRHGIIARCVINTGNPRWPARANRRVWYPVGQYETTLAGPDIAEAAAMGALISIGDGYVHRLGHALKPWADWCLSVAAGADELAPAVAQLTAKHWGRAEIGKWAQRGYETVEVGPAPTRGWDCTEAWHHTAGTHATIIDFDGRRWEATASRDGDNCYPAVLAWVEAYVRVRLGRLIDALPAGATLTWDTDGLLVDLTTLGDCPYQTIKTGPLTARIKNVYQTAELIGPQHMILDGRHRFAGVPASAQPGGDGRLYATLWPKLAWQMHHSQPGTYTRPVQPYRIAGTYAPGWVLADGAVVPVELAEGPAGANLIVPWPDTRHAHADLTLADTQNQTLERHRHAASTQPVAAR